MIISGNKAVICDTCGEMILRSYDRIIQAERHFCNNQCKHSFNWIGKKVYSDLGDKKNEKN